MPEVTASIAAYNAERYYTEAIDSLLNQTHPILELLLIVDCASTDRTVAIAESYVERDPRVRVVQVDHCNIPTKFARAVTEARGDWIAFLDSDDIALPHRIERCLEAAQGQPEVVAWFGWTWQIRPDGRRFRMVRRGPTDEQQFTALRREHEVPIFDHATGLFRRDALLAAGNYDPAIDVVPDYDIFERLSDVGLMLTIPEPLSEYRLHGGNNSFQSFEKQSNQFAYLWQRRAAKDRGEPFPSFDEFLARPPSGSPVRRWLRGTREKSRFYWNATGMHVACGRRGQALLAASQSILWNPRSVAHRLWRSYLRPQLLQHRRVATLLTRRPVHRMFGED